jgi:murein DD-endopeptidase MepM/ murein hydrolase activator NlpD
MITYSNLVKEQIGGSNWLDNVLNKVSSTISDTIKKVDDPTKADYVSDNVEDFYDTLNGIKNPLFQQEYGTMEHQKDVETVQMALILLGYPLPNHGVDGLFGPETANAVNKYKKDNNLLGAEHLNEETLESPVPLTGAVNSAFGEKRSYENHPGVDLPASSGTQVTSPADGVVINVASDSPKCGGTVTIQHGGGFKTRFCHLKEINVQQGQQLKQGENIGLSGGGQNDSGKGNATGAHLHFELYKDGSLVNPMDYINKGNLDLTSNPVTTLVKSVITPEMTDLMAQQLKQKGVKKEDLDKLIDSVTTGGSEIYTDLNLMDDNDYQKYASICKEFINRRNSASTITGDMMAKAAKTAFIYYHKYVPPELALAQLTAEGGLSNDTNARPIKTNNPFDVGNTATHSKSYSSVQDGINAYYNLIASSYLGKGKTANDLAQNFVNKNNENYSGNTDGGYEQMVSKIAKEANKIAKSLV